MNRLQPFLMLIPMWMPLGCAEPTVAVSGEISDLLGLTPLNGVSVCLADTTICADSDVNGEYTLDEVPASSQVELTFVLAEHAALLAPITTQEEPLSLRPLSMLTEALMEAQMASTEATGSQDLGKLVFSVSNGISGDGQNVESVSVSLKPSGGVGPLYLGPVGLPNSSLTATSSNGGGVWLDLDPDQYEMAFAPLPDDCFTLYGWDGANPLVIPVRSNHVSVARIECPTEP